MSHVCTARPHVVTPEVRDVAVGKVRAAAALLAVDHDQPADPPTVLGVELARAVTENA